MLHHKTSPNKLKKMEIISHIFSEHDGMKLKTNNKKNGKFKNIWRLKNTLVNGKTNGSMEKSKEKLKNTLR